MSRSKVAAVGLAVALLAWGGYLATGALSAHDAAPDIAFTRLDGQTTTLAALRGKVVLVNFWATSCTTCMHEMPAMVATHDKYRSRGYETLAVAMSYDPPDFVANYARTRRLPFQVAIDASGAIARSFGDVQLTPTSVLIDRQGRIVKRYVGEPDFVALHGLVERLLAAG